jgi:hypothetical protein
MSKKRDKLVLDNSILTSVKKEMAIPRMAKSARVAERNQARARFRERVEFWLGALRAFDKAV